MAKLHFAGHETFFCRNHWLKKGFDFISKGHHFNDEEAVVHLGVGKNMVSSIRFWLRAFNLTDENDEINWELADFLFREVEGRDPYLEDIGTVWLLHYMLVTHKRSSIYHLVFNEFRKQRVDFTRDHLQNYLENYCRTRDIHFHSNSIRKDIGVFLNNYLAPLNSKKGIEDSFNGLLYELGMVRRIEKGDLDRKSKIREWYSIESDSRENLPFQVVLFCILSNQNYSDAISFRQLLTDRDSVGAVFALSASGLMEIIEKIIQSYPGKVVFTDDGGVRVLQFKEKLDKWDVLSRYYE